MAQDEDLDWPPTAGAGGRRPRRSAEETRALILDEAEKLFRTLGYKRTAVGDIADKCGFSPSNVYRFFETKSAINEAIATRLTERLYAVAVQAAAGGDSPLTRLRRMLLSLREATMRETMSHAGTHEMVNAALEERWPSIELYKRNLVALIHGLIEEASQRGEVRSVSADAVAPLVFGATLCCFHPIMILESERQPHLGPEALVDFVIDALKRDCAE